MSGRSDARSDDTGAQRGRASGAKGGLVTKRAGGATRGATTRERERRLREPSFVIPEIADFRRQRGAAREREGAFGNAVILAEVRYSPVTKHYPVDTRNVQRPHRAAAEDRDAHLGRHNVPNGGKAPVRYAVSVARRTVWSWTGPSGYRTPSASSSAPMAEPS